MAFPTNWPGYAAAWSAFPCRASTESLNVAVATALMLYEIRKASLVLSLSLKPPRQALGHDRHGLYRLRAGLSVFGALLGIIAHYWRAHATYFPEDLGLGEPSTS